MRLSDVKPQKGSKKRRRRVGRGISAGQGASAGKGMRGQKARSGGNTRPGFEGGQQPLYRRIPKLKGFPTGSRTKYTTINVRQLATLPANTRVTLPLLIDKGILKTNEGPLKVLGDGELKVPLEVHAAAFTQTARTKIRAVGGAYVISIDTQESRTETMINQFEGELEKFLDSKKGWDSYDSEPPNTTAVNWGKAILNILRELEFIPTLVVRSPEGGVSVVFINESKYADLECFNNGEIVAITSDRRNQKDEPEVWDVNSSRESIKKSLEKIRHYLVQEAGGQRQEAEGTHV